MACKKGVDMASDEELNQIAQRFKSQLYGPEQAPSTPAERVISSREYTEFRKEVMPKPLTLYEKLAKFSGKLIQLKPDSKKEAELSEALKVSHLEITATDAFSFTALSTLSILFFGTILGLGIMQSGFVMFFFVVCALMALVFFDKLPGFVANNWRLKASNQMVICIFYVATYMRHTSNIENAIAFASEHISHPLATDLKKVLWDVESEKYSSVKESLDNYLERWRKWNLEFIESFHLIEASLYEPSDERRLSLIDKALEVILAETYEKMLHYAHNLNSPITMLHMLGVILPILGLVILPLMVNFMGGVQWYHIAMLYNFILPIVVFYMGKNILSTRPTGYGDSDITEQMPELKKYKNVVIKFGKTEIFIKPIIVSLLVGGIFLFAGLMPLILHAVLHSGWQAGQEILDIPIGENFQLLGYKPMQENPNKLLGPFGLGATILSLCIPLGAGLALSSYYAGKSKNVIKMRDEAKDLEKEFASGLFQLGNRIGDGLPVEMAFGKVADVMQDTKSGDFFRIVSANITKMGMSMQDALFNNRNGALVYYPSKVIESSMKVLLESAKKGPLICSQALVNISQYIKEIHRVDERLKDLLAEVISSMKSQISFLAPAIAGIVVGITSMITTIIGSLSSELNKFGTEGAAADYNVGLSSMQIFGDGIPTYYFQMVVGIYVVQVVYILTIMANGIENGSDSLSEQYMLGQNLRNSTLLYGVISVVVTVMFNIVALQILNVTTSMG
ncbi:MAG: hypothetical protein ABIG95_01180 [Candidatus Woesearchaeota archaeon]